MVGVGEQPGEALVRLRPPAAMCRVATETRSGSGVERSTVHKRPLSL